MPDPGRLRSTQEKVVKKNEVDSHRETTRVFVDGIFIRHRCGSADHGSGRGCVDAICDEP